MRTDRRRALGGFDVARQGQYLLAVLAFAVALAARFALAGFLPPTGFPFLTFFPAVVLATLFGGLGPGLVCAALSVAAAKYFFVPVLGSFTVDTGADVMALAFFGAVLLVDCIVIHLMTVSLARVKAERARSAALADAERALATELALRLGELGRREEELHAALAEGEAVRQRLEASETRLRLMNEDLEARVAAEVSAREAAQARAAHAERLQALGQLAGGIAHDINNVLQAVSGGAGLIERHAEDPGAVRRFARLVAEATGRGAAVTNRLLAFARRGELRALPIDPTALLEGLADILAHTLDRPCPIRLVLDLPPTLPPLLADKAQLETVIVNLAANARDAMPDGGTLTLAVRVERVRPGAAPGGTLRPGAYLRIAVADTGTGMSAEVLARVTEPFFTTKVIGQGTGLGLAMARGFAEQSGGALAIDSAVGRGTTVTLWLPQSGAAAEAPAEPGIPEGDLAGLRVLLVDDEPAVRETLAAQLRDHGCRVVTAPNGDAAMALLHTAAAFDALVTDLSMPGMTGLDLIRQAQARCPGLPAILLTGFAGDEAAAAAAYSLLRKPVTGWQLATLLGRVARTPVAATP